MNFPNSMESRGVLFWLLYKKFYNEILSQTIQEKNNTKQRATESTFLIKISVYFIVNNFWNEGREESFYQISLYDSKLLFFYDFNKNQSKIIQEGV